MARTSGIFGRFIFLLVFFIVLATPGCKAQSSAASPGFTPELTRRIQNEIRSRYSVPQSIEVSLSDPKPSETPGYDQIMVTFKGGSHTSNHEFLLSKDRKTLAHLEKFDISQDLMSGIDVKGRPVRGNAAATVTVVNFDDFECPFCSRMHTLLFPALLQAYGDRVKFIYKDYPLLEIHPWAMHAAVDANCLGEQNAEAYWDFADYIHGNQKTISGKSSSEAFAALDQLTRDQGQKHQLDPKKLQACVAKQDETAVRASMKEGDKLGVDSTPTLFVNGEKVSGAVPEDDMRAILNRALGVSSQPSAPSEGKK